MLEPEDAEALLTLGTQTDAVVQGGLKSARLVSKTLFRFNPLSASPTTARTTANFGRAATFPRRDDV